MTPDASWLANQHQNIVVTFQKVRKIPLHSPSWIAETFAELPKSVHSSIHFCVLIRNWLADSDARAQNKRSICVAIQTISSDLPSRNSPTSITECYANKPYVCMCNCARLDRFATSKHIEHVSTTHRPSRIDELPPLMIWRWSIIIIQHWYYEFLRRMCWWWELRRSIVFCVDVLEVFCGPLRVMQSTSLLPIFVGLLNECEWNFGAWGN